MKIEIGKHYILTKKPYWMRSERKIPAAIVIKKIRKDNYYFDYVNPMYEDQEFDRTTEELFNAGIVELTPLLAELL